MFVVKAGDTSQHTTCLAKVGTIHVENVERLIKFISSILIVWNLMAFVNGLYY